MPRETRLFVKTGMFYLGLTFVFGAVLAILEAIGHPAPFIASVEHGHLGFVGWLVNVVIGVALWMFPLDRASFPDTQGRYSVASVGWCYVLLNIGLPLRIVSEPWVQSGGSPFASGLLILSALMQLFAIFIFIGIAWRRVRAPARPAPGVS
jgi:hypothetical protein